MSPLLVGTNGDHRWMARRWQVEDLNVGIVRGFVLRLLGVEFHSSASRHGVAEEDVGLGFDDNREMVIHAMRMRSRYRPLIDGLLEGDE